MGKSKNISIRFDEDKTSFALSEEKIEKHQKLVDFLLDKYWWEKKIGNNSITERFDTITEVAKKEVLRQRKRPIPELSESIKTYTHPDPDYPIRKEGEGYIDYQLRCHEYSESKKIN